MKGVILFIRIHRGVKALLLLSPGNRVMEVHVNTYYLNCEKESDDLTSTFFNDKI